MRMDTSDEAENVVSAANPDRECAAIHSNHFRHLMQSRRRNQLGNTSLLPSPRLLGAPAMPVIPAAAHTNETARRTMALRGVVD
jgi:hypothetical protein